MSYSIKGQIKTIGQIEEVGSNGFTKRQIVVEVADGQYPQLIALELHKDKCSLADQLGTGQTATIHFDIRGREHNGRVFNNLVAWKIESEQGGTSAF